MAFNLPLNGPQLVTRSVRPPRVAYIVGTTEHCQAFVDVASLTWGGKYLCPVPYDPANGISDEWCRVLEMYDPDEIVTCLPLDRPTEERLLGMVVPDFELSEDRASQELPRWDLQVDEEGVHGLPLYSALAGAVGAGHRAQLLGAVSADHPTDPALRLFASARYGRLDERWSAELALSADLRMSTKLSDFVTPSLVALTGGILSTAVEREPAFESMRTKSLLDYTLVGLTEESSGEEWPDLSQASPLARDNRLLIVSEAPHPEDFCWFWNLRAQRYLDNIQLTMWLPLSEVRHNLAQCAQLFHPRAGGFLISETLAGDRLTELAGRLGAGVEAATSGLDRFYSRQHFKRNKDQCEVFFRFGRARLSVPKPEVTRATTSRQWYYLDMDVEDYRLPKLNTRHWGSSPWSQVDYRVSRTGLSFCRRGMQSGERDPIHVKVPDPWEMFEVLAAAAGYNIERSDKGLLAERLLDLVGDVSSLWMISGRTTVALLDELSELAQAKEFKRRLGAGLQQLASMEALAAQELIASAMDALSADRHDRVFKTAGSISDTLDFRQREAAPALTNWMLRRRLIYRGTEVTCPVCRIARWVGVDDLQSEMRCPSCRQLSDVNLDVDVTQWRYRMNALLARGIDQGILPHLLTLSHAANYVGPRLKAGKINAWVLGANLTARAGSGLPFPKVEVDVAWLADGGLVIGECKSQGRDLTLAEVDKYLDLADRIKCERVIFAALDDFASMDETIRQRLGGAEAEVELLTGAELLDQFPLRDLTRKQARPGASLDFESHLLANLQWR